MFVSIDALTSASSEVANQAPAMDPFNDHMKVCTSSCVAMRTSCGLPAGRYDDAVYCNNIVQRHPTITHLALADAFRGS